MADVHEWNLYHTDNSSNRVRGFFGPGGNFEVRVTKAAGRAEPVPLSVVAGDGVEFRSANGMANIPDVVKKVDNMTKDLDSARTESTAESIRRADVLTDTVSMAGQRLTQLKGPDYPENMTWKDTVDMYGVLYRHVAESAALSTLVAETDSTMQSRIDEYDTNVTAAIAVEAGIMDTFVTAFDDTTIADIAGIRADLEIDQAAGSLSVSTIFSTLATQLDEAEAAYAGAVGSVDQVKLELDQHLADLKGTSNLTENLDQLHELEVAFKAVEGTHGADFVASCSNVFELYKTLEFLTNTQPVDFILLPDVKDSFTQVAEDPNLYRSAAFLKEGVFETMYEYNVAQKKLFEIGSHRMPIFGNSGNQREVTGITLGVVAPPLPEQTKMQFSQPPGSLPGVYRVEFGLP